ncbi:hypothetical protein [Microbacterium lacticum]
MAADTDALLRRKYARNLAACIARNDLHSTLTAKTDEGVAPIVIALGHEKVDAVFGRIEAAGGCANLFVVDSNEKLHVVRMAKSTPGIREHSASSQNIADVHQNITMDFLVMFMAQQEGRSGSLRVSFSGIDVQAESAPKLALAGIA